MKTYKNIYEQIISFENLILAWMNARRGKTKKPYVIEFEKELFYNLMALHYELLYQTYKPKPLKTFILRDPKTRKISKSDFRDRIVHHAIVNVLEPIFDKTFIYDSWANRVGKGNLYALERFDSFVRKVSQNGKVNGIFNANQIKGYCFKADIKHYFDTVNHEILLNIVSKKIADDNVICLIRCMLNANFESQRERVISDLQGVGMPLGNLTSQFFGNVYLNELDYFIKHELKAKYYLRYVDDFVILHGSKTQLEEWKLKIDLFLRDKLKIELHPQKSRVISLSKGVDFVGFRYHYFYTLLRKRNIRKMLRRIADFENNEVSYSQLMQSFTGWQGYSLQANTFRLRKKMLKRVARQKYKRLEEIENGFYL